VWVAEDMKKTLKASQEDRSLGMLQNFTNYRGHSSVTNVLNVIPQSPKVVKQWQKNC
jgi:hypothetical protein